MGGLHYRENCYHCRYARAERISDLTFGDFDGLGIEKPFAYGNKQVSMCLVNTPKGEKNLKDVSARLLLEERTLEEAVKPQCQLKAPSPKHPMRETFLEIYKEQHDFTKAAKASLKKELKRNFVYQLKKRFIVTPMLRLTTQEQRERIKRIIKH